LKETVANIQMKRGKSAIVKTEDVEELAILADKQNKIADETAIVVASKEKKSDVKDDEVKENVKSDPQPPLKDPRPVKEPEEQLKDQLKDPPPKEEPEEPEAPHKEAPPPPLKLHQNAKERVKLAQTPPNVAKKEKN